jgi:hypothetical protein
MRQLSAGICDGQPPLKLLHLLFFQVETSKKRMKCRTYTRRAISFGNNETNRHDVMIYRDCVCGLRLWLPRD